jgi:hypothetical protein
VYPELKRLVPELVDICDLLRKHLYDPIMAGEEIKMAAVNLSVKDTSLLSRIREAVEQGGDDATSRQRYDSWWIRRDR